MAHRQTILPSSMRPVSNFGSSSASAAQSTALAARVEEKKAELASLLQLRDLSAGLVGQMEQLEAKISTLNNGAEAVAEVMANWGTVLRAIATASAGIQGAVNASKTDVELPQTLVRVPIDQAMEARRNAESEHAPND